MHLLCTDARQPLQELVNRRALVEVFEKGKHTETSAGDHPDFRAVNHPRSKPITD